MAKNLDEDKTPQLINELEDQQPNTARERSPKNATPLRLLESDAPHTGTKTKDDNWVLQDKGLNLPSVKQDISDSESKIYNLSSALGAQDQQEEPDEIMRRLQINV